MPFIYGDTIHADRAGGVSYYTIEGLYAQSNSTSESHQENMTVPTIRKTYTKEADKTPNIMIIEKLNFRVKEK